MEFDVQHHAAQCSWKKPVMYFMSTYTSKTGRELRTCHFPPLYRVFEQDSPNDKEIRVWVAIYYDPKDPMTVKSDKSYEITVANLLRQKTEAFDNVLTRLTRDEHASL